MVRAQLHADLSSLGSEHCQLLLLPCRAQEGCQAPCVGTPVRQGRIGLCYSLPCLLAVPESQLQSRRMLLAPLWVWTPAASPVASFDCKIGRVEAPAPGQVPAVIGLRPSWWMMPAFECIAQCCPDSMLCSETAMVRCCDEMVACAHVPCVCHVLHEPPLGIDRTACAKAIELSYQRCRTLTDMSGSRRLHQGCAACRSLLHQEVQQLATQV